MTSGRGPPKNTNHMVPEYIGSFQLIHLHPLPLPASLCPTPASALTFPPVAVSFPITTYLHSHLQSQPSPLPTHPHPQTCLHHHQPILLLPPYLTSSLPPPTTLLSPSPPPTPFLKMYLPLCHRFPWSPTPLTSIPTRFWGVLQVL